MPSASFALQQALFASLTSSPAVLAALGGARVYDDVPERATFPLLTFGQTTERDWSTATEPGSEHLVTLHVWSRKSGRKEADDILTAVQMTLHNAGLTLDGHRLVNLRHEYSEVRRDPDGATYHGLARFRAVTEPAS